MPASNLAIHLGIYVNICMLTQIARVALITKISHPFVGIFVNTAFILKIFLGFSLCNSRDFLKSYGFTFLTLFQYKVLCAPMLKVRGDSSFHFRLQSHFLKMILCFS